MKQYSGKQLTVHLVPYQDDAVTLDQIVTQLKQKPERKYTISEVSGLHAWYTKLSATAKAEAKAMIKSGQLEVAGGSWTTSDEATTNYEEIIDNILTGHHFLQKEFSYKPKVGWNIESRGHSATNAKVLAQLGFDSQFVQYIDTDLKQKLQSQTEQGLNFIWKQGDHDSILTSVIEPGSCPAGAIEMVNLAVEMSEQHKEVNLMMPLTCDYAKIDQLMAEAANLNKQVTFKVSTPS